MQENNLQTPEDKNDSHTPIDSIFTTIFKIISAFFKAIVFAFVSVFKAFRDVFKRLDAKSLLSFIFLVVVIIAVTFFIGYKKGESDKEDKFYDEIGLTKEQVKELRRFLDRVN